MVVIIAKYNAGKSSFITNIIDAYYKGFKKDIIYLTYTDQSKFWFNAKKSDLKFGKLTKNKIIIIDELSSDKSDNVSSYAQKLAKFNKLIILTNPYGSSNDASKEIALFKKNELLDYSNSLFVFVKS